MKLRTATVQLACLVWFLLLNSNVAEPTKKPSKGSPGKGPPTQVVEPMCGLICEGGSTQMEFMFTGGSCADSVQSQGDLFLCSEQGIITYPVHVIMKPASKKNKEDNGSSYFDGLVHNQNEILVAGNTDKIAANMEIEIWKENKSKLLQDITFHSSCSKNLFLGDTFGAVKLVGFTNQIQGVVTGCNSTTPIPSPSPSVSPSISLSPVNPKNPSPPTTRRPTRKPTRRPTRNPTAIPSSAPTLSPTSKPTLRPTSVPSLNPTSNPTSSPTSIPSLSPTSIPTSVPSLNLTSNPTSSPTSKPTLSPTTVPTSIPTSVPSLSQIPTPCPLSNDSEGCTASSKRSSRIPTLSTKPPVPVRRRGTLRRRMLNRVRG